jgi:hypothetical protein
LQQTRLRRSPSDPICMGESRYLQQKLSGDRSGCRAEELKEEIAS